jgi:hypothetical protein
VAQTRIHICRTATPEGLVDYVSLLPPDRGLIGEAIIGMLRTPDDGGNPPAGPSTARST